MNVDAVERPSALGGIGDYSGGEVGTESFRLRRDDCGACGMFSCRFTESEEHGKRFGRGRPLRFVVPDGRGFQWLAWCSAGWRLDVQRNTPDQSSDDDVSKACSMMNTARSEPVYGKDYLRYQLNEPQSPPDQVQRYDGQVDYAIVLYPQEENVKAAFQRLAVGFHMCQLSDGKHGWFTLGEDSASKLTWTTNEANGVDHLCAFDSRIARNVFITARVCGERSLLG